MNKKIKSAVWINYAMIYQVFSLYKLIHKIILNEEWITNDAYNSSEYLFTPELL